MKENMLLQYSDDLMKVELRSLRGEVLQFVAQYGGSCAAAAENAARRAGSQSDQQLQQVLDHLKKAKELQDQQTQQIEMLQRILNASEEHAERLDRLETWTNPEVGGRSKSFQTRHATLEGGELENGGQLDISGELQSLREQLEMYVRATSSRVLPAGMS